MLSNIKNSKAEEIFSNNIFQEFKMISHVNNVNNIRSTDTLCFLSRVCRPLVWHLKNRFIKILDQYFKKVNSYHFAACQYNTGHRVMIPIWTKKLTEILKNAIATVIKKRGHNTAKDPIDTEDVSFHLTQLS